MVVDVRWGGKRGEEAEEKRNGRQYCCRRDQHMYVVVACVCAEEGGERERGERTEEE